MFETKKNRITFTGASRYPSVYIHIYTYRYIYICTSDHTQVSFFILFNDEMPPGVFIYMFRTTLDILLDNVIIDRNEYIIFLYYLLYNDHLEKKSLNIHIIEFC